MCCVYRAAIQQMQNRLCFLAVLHALYRTHAHNFHAECVGSLTSSRNVCMGLERKMLQLWGTHSPAESSERTGSISLTPQVLLASCVGIWATARVRTPEQAQADCCNSAGDPSILVIRGHHVWIHNLYFLYSQIAEHWIPVVWVFCCCCCF